MLPQFMALKGMGADTVRETTKRPIPGQSNLSKLPYHLVEGSGPLRTRHTSPVRDESKEQENGGIRFG